jgi:hypothetical protein
MNAIVERWIKSCRKELLDRTLEKQNPAKPEPILTGGLKRRMRFIEPPSPPRCDASTQQSPSNTDH